MDARFPVSDLSPRAQAMYARITAAGGIRGGADDDPPADPPVETPAEGETTEPPALDAKALEKLANRLATSRDESKTEEERAKVALTDEELTALHTALDAEAANLRAVGQEATSLQEKRDLVTAAKAVGDTLDLVRTEETARAEAIAALDAEMATELERFADATKKEGDEETTPPAEEEPPVRTDGLPDEVKNPVTTPNGEPEIADPPSTQQAEPPVPVAAAAPNLAQLSQVRRHQPARTRPREASPDGRTRRGLTTITAAAGMSSIAPGAEFPDWDTVGEAMIEQFLAGAGTEDTAKVRVATLNTPAHFASTTLQEDPYLMDRIFETVGDQSIHRDRKAITAAVNPLVGLTAAGGGLCGPTDIIYDWPEGPGNARTPIGDAIQRVPAGRGRLQYPVPYSWADIELEGRAVTDGATTSGSATVTSATANFTTDDIGRPISGAGIPAGSVVTARASGTSITISQNATATATGVTLTIGNAVVNPWTLTMDAANPQTNLKLFAEVLCPTWVEVDIGAYYQGILFHNFADRFNPEVNRNFVRELPKVVARYMELARLAPIDAASGPGGGLGATGRRLTAGTVLGTSRDVAAALILLATRYRSGFRMGMAERLEMFAPEWLPWACLEDNLRVMPGDGDFEDTLQTITAEVFDRANVDVVFSPDINRLTSAAQTVGGGAQAIAPFPTTARAYVHRPGTYANLDGGRMDLGVLRDKSLVEKNQFATFVEWWEQVFQRLPHAWSMDMTIAARGNTAGTVANASPGY